MADSALCAIVMMGVSGSGKTTVAKALAARIGWTYRDGDAFHPPANVAKMSAGHPLDDADRAPWLAAIASAIDKAANAGKPMIVACSALKRAYRDGLVHGRDDVVIVYLEGSQALIAKRMAARKDHFMPPALLESQFAALEPPDADEPSIAVSIDSDVDDIVDAIVTGLHLTESAKP